MRFINYAIAVLLASIPGAVLPVACFLLFAQNTTATRRDVLPSLNNPLEAVGWWGFIFSSIPMLITIIILFTILDSVHKSGFVIPFFDSLTSKSQIDIAIIIGLICNVLVWTMLILSFMRRKKEVVIQSSVVIAEGPE